MTRGFQRSLLRVLKSKASIGSSHSNISTLLLEQQEWASGGPHHQLLPGRLDSSCCDFQALAVCPGVLCTQFCSVNFKSGVVMNNRRMHCSAQLCTYVVDVITSPPFTASYAQVTKLAE